MKVEDIEIHAGKPPFAYIPVRQLEVKCEASTALSPAPTIDEANGRLRAMAAKIGADAVAYKSGVSMTSWKSLKATGLAVRRESDERACPRCGEMIKKSAILCRFCNSEVLPYLAPAGKNGLLADQTSSSDGSGNMMAEPLRETNNPQMWLIVGAVLFVLFFLLSLAH